MATFSALLCLLCCLCGISQCQKVLVIFPMASGSHHLLGKTLSKALLEHGMEVTMISPFETRNPTKNYSEVVLTGIEEEFQKTLQTGDNSTLYDWENIPAYIQPVLCGRIGKLVTSFVLEHPNLKKLLQSNQKFDAVIIEQFSNDGLKMLAHHYKAPLIIFSSMASNVWISMLNGVPEPPSYLPDLFLSYGTAMTFLQRTNNFLMRILHYSVFYLWMYPAHNQIVKKHFPNYPELTEVLYNASLVLLNSHESISPAMPHVPNMVSVGGYHITPPKELPKDLKNFMDNAKEGVIYFSMGSNLVPSQMPPKIQDAILKVLGSRKEKVLWKWDREQLENKPSNTIISKWFPQQDILAHPNTKLFITHCGLLSITETIYYGVPILGFPIFGDQKLNANRARALGFGNSIPFSKLNEENLNKAVNELLDNPKYRANAKYRSQIFHDRPVKPTDLIGYWVKYVIRHRGAPHLGVAGIDLPWYQYLMLDVVAVLFGAICVVLFILIRLIKFCFRTKKSEEKLKRN